MKLATAAVIITAVFIAIHQSRSWMDMAITVSTNVLGNTRKCKTLMWKVTIPDNGGIIQGIAFEPYYVKLLLPDGKIWLLNRCKKKVVLLNPVKKTAKISFIEDQPPDIYEALSDLLDMSQFPANYIGQRKIEEIQAIGFRAYFGQDQATVWIDHKTQLPIRIEFLETNKWGQMELELIWSDIVFDVELDESLFRFDLAGYNVEEVDSFRNWQEYCPLASIEAKTNL